MKSAFVCSCNCSGAAAGGRLETEWLVDREHKAKWVSFSSLYYGYFGLHPRREISLLRFSTVD